MMLCSVYDPRKQILTGFYEAVCMSVQYVDVAVSSLMVASAEHLYSSPIMAGWAGGTITGKHMSKHKSSGTILP